MATGGGEMREPEIVPVPVTNASGFVRSVAGFAFVHAAVTLVMFLVLEEQNAQHFCQCMEACWVLSIVEACGTGTLFLVHATMTVCSVVQILAAALALLPTGCLRRAASFVALGTTVATGMQPIRLIYADLFDTQCCFSGGIVQVAFAVVVAVGQLGVACWGGMVAVELVLAPLPCEE